MKLIVTTVMALYYKDKDTSRKLDLYSKILQLAKIILFRRNI